MNLTLEKIDAVQQLIKTEMCQATTVLSEMLDADIYLTPYIKFESVAVLQQEIQTRLGTEQVAAVRQDFSGLFPGIAALIFPTKSADLLTVILTGEAFDTPDLEQVQSGTLSELGNILINSVIGFIGNLVNQKLEYKLPLYTEDKIGNLLKLWETNRDDKIFLFQTHFVIEPFQIQTEIILIFEGNSFEHLVRLL